MIEVNQYYRSADPRDEGRTLRVVAAPSSTPGTPSFQRVGVVTVHPDGREDRLRAVDAKHFHEFELTQNETVRKTGYVLVRP